MPQVEKTKTKTMPKKMTRQRTKHVKHVTNLRPFDKKKIDKSEDLKEKRILLRGKEKKARLEYKRREI